MLASRSRCDSLLSISAANGHWYLRPGRESTLHLPALPYEELLLLARAVFSADYFEFELLDSLLSALESLPQVRQAVSEADLVQMSVELLGRALEAEPERSKAPSEDRSPLLLIIDETIANFRPWLERVPTWVILAPHAALIGASAALDRAIEVGFTSLAEPEAL